MRANLSFLWPTWVLICATLNGCSDIVPIRDGSFGTVQGQYSTAEYRLISQRKRSKSAEDQLIVCSEASPDVAKAFSSAISANVSHGTATEGVSYQQSEAIAQLGKRYATIQLLRDIRFRDCEDYANGIIDKVEYGYRLSRFSGLVVTLLGIEMVSGDNATSPPSVPSPTIIQTAAMPLPNMNAKDKNTNIVAGDTSAADQTTGDTSTTKPGPASDAASGTATGKSNQNSTETETSDEAPSAADVAKQTIIAAGTMSTVDSAVKAASNAFGNVSTNPIASDASAVTALGGALTIMKRVGNDLDTAWAALQKAQGKSDSGASKNIKAAATDVANLKLKIIAADTHSKTASIPVANANMTIDATATKLVSASKALTNLDGTLAKVGGASGTSPGSNGPGTKQVTPGSISVEAYRKVSDVQATTIAAMQKDYMSYDNEKATAIPCASVENDLAVPIEDGKLNAFQVYCLTTAELTGVLPENTVREDGLETAAIARGAAATEQESVIPRLSVPILLPTLTQAARLSEASIGASFSGSLPQDVNKRDGIVHERLGYNALEAFTYPIAAAEFAAADKAYPGLGDARELAAELEALPAHPTSTEQCTILHDILSVDNWHLPERTKNALLKRRKELKCT